MFASFFWATCSQFSFFLWCVTREYTWLKLLCLEFLIFFFGHRFAKKVNLWNFKPGKTRRINWATSFHSDPTSPPTPVGILHANPPTSIPIGILRVNQPIRSLRVNHIIGISCVNSFYKFTYQLSSFIRCRSKIPYIYLYKSPYVRSRR